MDKEDKEGKKSSRGSSVPLTEEEFLEATSGIFEDEKMNKQEFYNKINRMYEMMKKTYDIIKLENSKEI